MSMREAVVEVTRGPVVESRHRGILAVVDADGAAVVAMGDVERPVFARSAVKLMQALPLIESGAADALGLTVSELSIAGASHNGEPAHVDTARAMLTKAGLSPDALECGTQWPDRMDDMATLIRANARPTALHNNCSGKHAGFLCLACTMGVDPAGYVEPDHPVQREITAALSAMTETPLDASVRGIDGCSIPTYAIPLSRVARGFARMGTGTGLAPARATAAWRLRQAAAAEPFMVAGTGRFCTEVMGRFGERAYVKTGAEGVFCAILPERGLGVALKVDDGGTRASEALMAAVLQRFVAKDDEERTFLDTWAKRAIRTRREKQAGEVRVAAETLAGLGV
ncbi:asparaginase [Pseudoxanthobacter sp. M-2]|uniref:asparaginase n=1 Tax=Pseudoxanthobacter sp. M-2 TaxID=3078754 RepID=UPI0038FCF6A9